MAGEKLCAGTYLYGAADPCDMGDFCDYGYGAVGRVSGQSRRISQRGHTGRSHAVGSVSQRVWRTFGSMRYFCDTAARKAVLEVEGSLVCSVGSAGYFLVVG